LAQYFLDTSAAVKYYHTEVGTTAVCAIFAEPGRRLRISNLGFVEIQSAFAMKVRSGVLHPNAAGMQRARLLQDVATGEIEVFRITEDHFAAAVGLIGRHGFQSRLRTLDALQLAVVLDLQSQGLLDTSVVADQTLGELASLEGVSIINPERP
jgi:hypothetical protein